jgi:DDE family transposase
VVLRHGRSPRAEILCDDPHQDGGRRLNSQRRGPCSHIRRPVKVKHDITQLLPLIRAVAPVRGRPRQRPNRVYADRGYDHDKYRRQVRAKGITPVIARRGTEHGSGLGVHRWVIEQFIALLHWFRRLRIRREIRDDIHEAFLSLACAIICWRRLRNRTSLARPPHSRS